MFLIDFSLTELVQTVHSTDKAVFYSDSVLLLFTNFLPLPAANGDAVPAERRPALSSSLPPLPNHRERQRRKVKTKHPLCFRRDCSQSAQRKKKTLTVCFVMSFPSFKPSETSSSSYRNNNTRQEVYDIMKLHGIMGVVFININTATLLIKTSRKTEEKKTLFPRIRQTHEL